MTEFLKSLQTNSAKEHAKSPKMQKIMARLTAESKRGRWSVMCSVGAITNDDKEALLALGVSVVYRTNEQLYVISWRERNRPAYYQPSRAIPVTLPEPVKKSVEEALKK